MNAFASASGYASSVTQGHEFLNWFIEMQRDMYSEYKPGETFTEEIAINNCIKYCDDNLNDAKYRTGFFTFAMTEEAYEIEVNHYRVVLEACKQRLR